ncbi:MAG: cytochrome c [Acidimicrobiia bacterium]|nr:cytochrome c [Acidimicrobiia bacterium]
MRTRVFALVLLLAVGAAGCGESLEGKFGVDLFEAACARCHAADGSGGIGPAIGTADSNAAENLTDEMIRGVIRVGPGRMPSFDRLTEAQVDSLVVLLRSLQHGDVPPGGD